MDKSFVISEARRSLYEFLDRMLLAKIDDEVFLSRDAEIETVNVGFDISTFGNIKEPHDRLMFTDSIQLRELLDEPTGDTHKTYESGLGMAATTHGDTTLTEAQSWCDTWWQDYAADSLHDLDDLWETFGEAGLTTPINWYNELDGTLGDLRSRCKE